MSENNEYFDEYIMHVKRSMIKKAQIEKEFLIYLDKEDILKELELTAIHYEKTVNSYLKKRTFLPPFRFHLKLDLIKLQDTSEKLHQLFIKEPNAGMNLAENVLFYGVQMLLSNIPLKKSDLQIIPVVINLPVTCEIFDLLRSPSLGLECVQGVLMSKTTVTKYVRSRVCSCEVQFCPRNQWQRYPGNFGKICPACLSLMEEDVSSVDTGEEIICQMISLISYQSQGRFQVLNVRIRDEFCTSINFSIGEEYIITGKLTVNFFEAVNVTVKQSGPEMNLSTCVLPKSITDLYHAINAITSHCPWSFVYALSSTLGSQLIPVSSYLHLKMGLMLGLSTQKNNEPPTPLIAIGSDSVNIQYLFHIAGKLAERYVKRSTAHSYLGGAAKPGLGDVIWLEAGQLILAANGVCNLGDWCKFKKEQANYICQTIESGQIVLNKGDSGKNNIIDFAQLKCAIWTYWCHITTSRNHQLQLKTLINVFGIPFLAEEKNELEIKKICLKNLEQGKNPFCGNSNTIPLEDLKEFIKIINTKELSLSDAASQVIRNYFVVSRRERPYCLPMGAIKIITSLAEAHARLALRNEVSYEDVVAIIYLYEESISALFGESINSYSKLNWDQEEPIYVFVCIIFRYKNSSFIAIFFEQYIHSSPNAKFNSY